MNCGMEDCIGNNTILKSTRINCFWSVLDDAFDKHGEDISKALEDYSKMRNPDAEAMCDLAMYNYIEVDFHDRDFNDNVDIDERSRQQEVLPVQKEAG